jgi:predicted amidohydrolase YtcJ
MREYGLERTGADVCGPQFPDAGIRVTQTSDYPPGPFEPMMALRSMVTRIDSKGNPWGLKQRLG